MDLGDRCRGQGGLVDPLEHVGERTAEVLLDRAAHGVERLGLHLVAALLELADELGREQPLAGGDDLAELDVARPEHFRRLTQALRDVGSCDLRARVLVAPATPPPGADGPQQT